MKGLIDLNKLLFEEYGYNNKEDILSHDFAQIELNGKREKFWFVYKGQLYLYKKQAANSCDMYSELLAKTIADLLGINCAEYYPAIFNDELGVITKNFLKRDEKLILATEIISDTLNKNVDKTPDFLKKYNIESLNVKDIHNKLNNLEDMWSILDLYFNNTENKEETVNLIVEEFLKYLFFDMITIQGDRNIGNLGIIKNNLGQFVRVAPLYDNSNIFGLNRKSIIKPFNGMVKSLGKTNDNNEKTFEQIQKMLYHSKLIFSTSEDDILDITSKKRKNNLEIIEDFLKITSKEQIYLLLSYLDIIDNYNIENIINDCEKRYNIIFPNDIKEHYYYAFFINCLLIREKIEQYLYERKLNDGKRK